MTERKRIGYVLSQFPCYDETFILREMRALSARGVEIVIFSLRNRPQAIVQEDALAFVSSTRYAPYAGREALRALLTTLRTSPRPLVSLLSQLLRELWRRPLTLVKAMAFLPKSLFFAELARSEKIHRIHAHWATHPATAALLMSRLTGIPWSFTCHAHDIFSDPILLAHKLSSADFALTCTAYNKTYLDRMAEATNGAREHRRARIRVSYHGLDLTLFRPLADRPARAEISILAVGSLLECKGFRYLIDACALLAQRGLSFRATIAGGGPEAESLRRAVSERGLSGTVSLAGYVTQRELVPLYQAADVLVLPAVAEIHWGIPNVLVEALACGVPVITTALPSVPELVEHGVNGLLVADRDPGALADGIERLSRDPALRRTMGRRGRERVERLFDIDRTIETVLEPLIAS